MGRGGKGVATVTDAICTIACGRAGVSWLEPRRRRRRRRRRGRR